MKNHKSASNIIRPAVLADAASIAAIYNEGIRGRNATFETDERQAADVELWIAEGGRLKHPFLVAEHQTQEGVQVAGWVRASTYRTRYCYRGIAEFSVYVSSQCRGIGIGEALMQHFIPRCEASGHWKLLSRIFPENLSSRALCKRVGFREVGVYEKHATLDGVWRDVVIVERLLGENSSTKAGESRASRY